MTTCCRTAGSTRTKFDAEGHRGSRGLRPENTLPAFEAGLDNLMNTMETDTGITRDGVPVISHDPFLDPTKCRNADGSPLGGDILIRDLTARQIQHEFVCDLTLPTFPRQTNDPTASPVAVAYARAHHLDPYAKPRLQDLFDFADFYARWFSTGPGRTEPGAAVKARNARTVHFNVETKINPVPQFASRTVSAEAFERIDDGLIARNHLESRVTLQSFDWRTLLLAQRNHPRIATVALWGDSPDLRRPDDRRQRRRRQPAAGRRQHALARRAGLAVAADPADAAGARSRPAAGTRGWRSRRTAGRSTRRWRSRWPARPTTPRGSPSSTSAAGRSPAPPGRTRSTRPGSACPTCRCTRRGAAVAIERDNSTGTLDGLKAVYAVSLPAGGGTVTKTPVADLLHLADPAGIARRDRFAQPGDLVGAPGEFAMPYVTIESVVVSDPRTLVIANDNNYPFSIGRHLGTQRTDDDDLVAIRLDQALPGERGGGPGRPG